MIFLALYRLFLRHQLTKGRIFLLFFLAALTLFIAIAISIQMDTREALEPFAAFVFLFGVGLAIPITSLTLAGATFGQLVEDETLVYLWLRPSPRWILATSAWLATATVIVPTVAVPFGISSLLATQDTGFAATVFIATALGTLTYTAFFVFLGLLTKRSLVWGLLYIFLWESLVSAIQTPIANLSIANYARSIIQNNLRSKVSISELIGSPVSTTTATFVLLALIIIGVTLTTWRLNKTTVA